MARFKEREKIYHKPSTLEIFGCLSGKFTYAKILAAHTTEKAYATFLQWIIEKEFYSERNENISIKKIAADFKSEPTKVTKWIKDIYADIFDLNYDKPELFQRSGIKVCFYCRYYDDSCFLNTFVAALPREFETVKIPFVKGKMGTDYFWVEKIEHQFFDDEHDITIWLKSGSANKYRQFALDKALYQGHIHWADVFHKYDYELDQEIKRIYRD